MQVSANSPAAYVAELASCNFHSFTDLVSNMTLGLYESLAPSKQGVCRHLFLRQQRERENQTNLLCVQKVDALLKSQGEKEINVKLRQEKPDRYLEQSLREIIHLEQKLADEELRRLRGKIDFGSVRLKVNDATFVSHRWLESILDSEGLQGEKRAAAHRKILEGPGDYEIFTSNMGFGGEGSNRSAFGIFTEYALKALKLEADSILQRVQMPYKKQDARRGYWKIPKGRELLKKLSTDDRVILLMNGLYQTFGSLQCLRGAALENILKIISPVKAGQCQPSRPEYPVDTVKELDEFAKRVESIVPSQSRALPHLSQEASQTYESFCEIFFFQSRLLYHDLKNLIHFLDVHLADDFTHEEHVMALAIQTGALSVQATHESEKTGKDRGSAIYAPPALGNPARTGSVIRYSRSKNMPTTEDRAQEIVRLLSFSSAFQNILQTIRCVNKVYKTYSATPTM